MRRRRLTGSSAARRALRSAAKSAIGQDVGGGDAALGGGHGRRAPSGEAVGAGQHLDRVGLGGLRGAGGQLGPPAGRGACRPAGSPSTAFRCAFWATRRAAGLPTFTAMAWVSFITPKVPPWPEQRSTRSTLVSGISRSISADLAPMFWARAWQAWCRVTPPSTGAAGPARGRGPWRASTTYSQMSRVALASVLDRLALGQDQRPLELHHQAAAGGEGHDVLAVVDPAAEARRRRVSARSATSARSPASSWGMPQQTGIDHLRSRRPGGPAPPARRRRSAGWL